MPNKEKPGYKKREATKPAQSHCHQRTEAAKEKVTKAGVLQADATIKKTEAATENKGQLVCRRN
jgi:hypothetical protein